MKYLVRVWTYIYGNVDSTQGLMYAKDFTTELESLLTR